MVDPIGAHINWVFKRAGDNATLMVTFIVIDATIICGIVWLAEWLIP